MANENKNKQWSKNELASLEKMVKENTPTRVIAMHLGRTVPGIQAKAQQTGMSLKPTNQSPYNRRK